MSQQSIDNTKMAGNTPQSTPGDAGSSSKSAKPTPATPAAPKTWAKDCAVLVDNLDGYVIASGKALGKASKIGARLVASRAADTTHWMGFQLEFPLDQAANEASGFGVRHQGKSPACNSLFMS